MWIHLQHAFTVINHLWMWVHQNLKIIKETKLVVFIHKKDSLIFQIQCSKITIALCMELLFIVNNHHLIFKTALFKTIVVKKELCICWIVKISKYQIQSLQIIMQVQRQHASTVRIQLWMWVHQNSKEIKQMKVVVFI